jgi:hypothetical protein
VLGAGGQWHPFGHYDAERVTPEWRAQFLAAADYSWRRFQILVGDDYGIRWLPTYVEDERGARAAAPPDVPSREPPLARRRAAISGGRDDPLRQQVRRGRARALFGDEELRC